mgnify:FL=1
MPSEPVWVCLPVSDGISRKKGLELGSKPFALQGYFWFLRMISSSWGMGL